MTLLADPPVTRLPSFLDRLPRVTPEDLLELPDGEHFELVDGMLKENDMGFLTSLTTGELYRRLSAFVKENRSGWTPPGECGYQCFPHKPEQVRKPDMSFIARGRLTRAQYREGHVRIPPDLAVEVVSPHDRVNELEDTIQEYLTAGVRVIWVVHPASNTAAVYRQNRTATHLGPEDSLDGEDVLPGFSCALASLCAEPPEDEDGA